MLQQMKYRAKLFYGDGYKGKDIFAPFDKILITCGAPFVPEALVEQLKPGGIMVIPVGRKVQEMKRIIRTSETEYIEENWGGFRFVPFLEGKVEK